MKLRVTDLLCCSPFEHGVWYQDPLSIYEVGAAIREDRLDSRSWDSLQDEDTPDERKYHTERVAYLVVNPDPTPLYINVGYGKEKPSDWPLQDGHHRLAAALYRGDEYIEANITGHSRWTFELFGFEPSQSEVA